MSTGLQIGDTVSIQLFPSGRHEGIVISDGVIVSRSLKYGGVVALRPSQFADGNLRTNHGLIGRFSRQETAKRAEARIGERGYNLITNNCLHFVNEVNGLPRQARFYENAGRLAQVSDITNWLSRPLW